jgi:hypothetical protein
MLSPLRSTPALTLVLGLVLPLVGAVLAPQKPPHKPAPKPVTNTPQKPGGQAPKLEPFIGHFEDAKKNAKERNVPLLVHIVLEGDEASDRYRDKVLPDLDLLKKSPECLVVIANNGTHPKKTIDDVVEGNKVRREVCSVFPMFATCGQHQKMWDELYAEFQGEDHVLHCPQTVVLGPDGKISARMNNGQPPQPSEIVAGIAEAQAKAGPGLTQAQLDEVKRLLEEGRNLMVAKSWPDAWRTWQKVIALAGKTAWADEPQREAPKALDGVEQDLARITALLVPGSAAKAFKELSDYAKTLAGMPPEKETLARVKKAENDKAIRDEIAQWKLGVEADQLLTEARDLFDQKQEKKAAAVVRRLLGKRYASTAAAKNARELWPEIAKEEDDKPPH